MHHLSVSSKEFSDLLAGLRGPGCRAPENPFSGVWSISGEAKPKNVTPRGSSISPVIFAPPECTARLLTVSSRAAPSRGGRPLLHGEPRWLQEAGRRRELEAQRELAEAGEARAWVRTAGSACKGCGCAQKPGDVRVPVKYGGRRCEGPWEVRRPEMRRLASVGHGRKLERCE